MRREIFEAIERVFLAIEQALGIFSKNAEQSMAAALLYDMKMELRDALNGCQKSIPWIDDGDLPNDSNIKTIKYISEQYEKEIIDISLEINERDHFNDLIDSLRHLSKQIPSVVSAVTQKKSSKEFIKNSRSFAEWNANFFQNASVIDGYIKKTAGLPFVKEIIIHTPSSSNVNYLCIDMDCYYKYIEQHVERIQFYIFESFQFNRQLTSHEDQSLSLAQWSGQFFTRVRMILTNFSEQLSEAKKIGDIDEKEIALYQLLNFYNNNDIYRIAILEALIEALDRYKNHLMTLDIDTTKSQKIVMDKIRNAVHRLPLNYQEIPGQANTISTTLQEIYSSLKIGSREEQTKAWRIFSNLQPLPKTLPYTCPHVLALWYQYKAFFLLLDLPYYRLKQWTKAPEHSVDLNFPNVLHIYPNGENINFAYKAQNAIQTIDINPKNTGHSCTWIRILENLKNNSSLTDEQNHFIFQQLARYEIYKPNRSYEDQTVSEAVQYLQHTNETLKGFDDKQAHTFFEHTLRPFQILIEKGSEEKNKTNINTLRRRAENEACERAQQLSSYLDTERNYYA